MYLDEIKVQQFRNLQPSTVTFSNGVNLIVGENGSGKTSLLEAIYLLSLGRSFRSRKTQQLIQNNSQYFNLFGKVNEADRSYNCCVFREKQGKTQIKINDYVVLSASELAQRLPIVLINASAFDILERGPSTRRRFIDWGVFHVEHSFAKLWRSYNQCLIQRNVLLKNRNNSSQDKVQQLKFWTNELVKYGEQIDKLRQDYCALLINQIKLTAQSLSVNEEMENLNYEYYRGWPLEQSLSETLAANSQRDNRDANTYYGPHRADLRISNEDTKSVENFLSRGQQKILVIAMLLAQGKIYTQQRNQNCVYLVDDLPAELDDVHQKKVAELLLEMQVQVFVSGIQQQSLVLDWQKADKIKMFHVEQGSITSLSC